MREGDLSEISDELAIGNASRAREGGVGSATGRYGGSRSEQGKGNFRRRGDRIEKSLHKGQKDLKRKLFEKFGRDIRPLAMVNCESQEKGIVR